jgi:hypothetical protein
MIFIYITGNCRFVNHEKSKKHKENVVFLREEMTADNDCPWMLSFSPDP